jgi:hypothetical protein
MNSNSSSANYPFVVPRCLFKDVEIMPR